MFNVRPHQTRVAFVKEGALKDIFYHRDHNPSLMGALYKGEVSRLAKKLNFAFVDLGMQKSGFLYGGDSAKRGRPLINKTLKPGDFVLVQVKSDPARDKGPRLTRDISLSGRYLVYMPTQEKKVAVSRRISNGMERERLHGILKALDESCAVIARTLAEGRGEDDLKKDLESLKNKWARIQTAFKERRSVGEIQAGLDPGLTYLQDLMDENVETVWVDDKEAFSKVRDFVKDLDPDLKSRVKFFSKKRGLFTEFDIETQIERAGQKKVQLKNGGSLVIEELEAFTVIDVNSGRFMGKKGDLQSAILSVNQSAARMIVQQVRLRHLGGIILIDFIDMESEENKKKLIAVLEEGFADDRSRPKVFPMAELGLVQITRKRERHSLSAFLFQNCPACGGQGHVKSRATTAGDIFSGLGRLDPSAAVLFEKIPFPKSSLSPHSGEMDKRKGK